jgi:hypothetical protein
LPNKVALKEGSHNILVKIRGYENWPYKIVYASNGITLNTTLDTINKYYEENNTIPNNKRPDIIHVCGKYNIIRVGENATTRGGQKIEANTFWGHQDTSDAYTLLTTILSIQEILLASKEIYYNYSELVNKLLLSKKSLQT